MPRTSHREQRIAEGTQSLCLPPMPLQPWSPSAPTQASQSSQSCPANSDPLLATGCQENRQIQHTNQDYFRGGGRCPAVFCSGAGLQTALFLSRVAVRLPGQGKPQTVLCPRLECGQHVQKGSPKGRTQRSCGQRGVTTRPEV